LVIQFDAEECDEMVKGGISRSVSQPGAFIANSRDSVHVAVTTSAMTHPSGRNKTQGWLGFWDFTMFGHVYVSHERARAVKENAAIHSSLGRLSTICI
jgi:hypothetical protein